MRYAFCLVALSIISLSGCRSSFAVAQGGLSPYKIFINGSGNIDFATNMTYAYAEGEGAVEVGILHRNTGQIIWRWPTEPVTGRISQGWQLVWDDAKKRPKIIEIPIEEARQALAPKN